MLNTFNCLLVVAGLPSLMLSDLHNFMSVTSLSLESDIAANTKELCSM